MVQSRTDSAPATAVRVPLSRMLAGVIVVGVLTAIAVGVPAVLRVGAEGVMSAALGSALAMVLIGLGLVAVRALLERPGAPTMLGVVAMALVQIVLAAGAVYGLVWVSAVDLWWLGVSFAATALACQMAAVVRHRGVA